MNSFMAKFSKKLIQNSEHLEICDTKIRRFIQNKRNRQNYQEIQLDLDGTELCREKAIKYQKIKRPNPTEAAQIV
jgi:hypothetical protein